MDLSSNASMEDNFFMDIFFDEVVDSQDQEDKAHTEEIESNVKSIMLP